MEDGGVLEVLSNDCAVAELLLAILEEAKETSETL
jgi:hypothetical protein